MNTATQAAPTPYPELDRQLEQLSGNRQAWVETPVAQRIAILDAIKQCLMPVSRDWAETAAQRKGIAEGSPLAGEEWLSGPYTVMNYCNQMMATLSRVQGKKHLDGVPLRELPNGQLVARDPDGPPRRVDGTGGGALPVIGHVHREIVATQVYRGPNLWSGWA